MFALHCKVFKFQSLVCRLHLGTLKRSFSRSNKPVKKACKSYDLVIIGGGSGGLSVASRFARFFKSKPASSIAVIEPRNMHYYQPLWTLVGAGLEKLESSAKTMAELIPDSVDWIQESCSHIDPVNNRITVSGLSKEISYNYLVVAAGLNLDWNLIDGLEVALSQPNSGVCSNYSERTVLKTWDILRKFELGHAIFTFPNTPVKCAGAPQKIMYLTEAHLNKIGKRLNCTITYNTSLPAIFGVPYYAKPLMEICQKRDINVNLRTNLVRIDPKRKIAFFEKLDEHRGTPLVEMQYDMIHVTPPMSAPKFCRPLAIETSNGFVAVDQETLQHVKYQNIFALGDCSSLPTSKTAAAIASQNYILSENLWHLMKTKNSKNFQHRYDGYTSCPLVTGNNRCILAEFDYQLKPVETFPLDQSKERISMFYMKRSVLPQIYWNIFLKGYWRGPGFLRNAFHFGLSKKKF